MIAKLPLVPFVIINFTRLTAGVCMKVRLKSKVTRDFTLSCRFMTRLLRSRLKKNLWDQGIKHAFFVSDLCLCTKGGLLSSCEERLNVLLASFEREVEKFPLKKWCEQNIPF